MRRRDAVLLLAAAPAAAADFASAFPPASDQVWLGPEYWANRLQDWRLRNGRMECHSAGEDRNVFLLTHDLSSRPEPFETRVKIGEPEENPARPSQGWIGFRMGMRGPFQDYRDTAIYGVGLEAGVNVEGRLFIGDLEHSAPANLGRGSAHFELVLSGTPKGSAYALTLRLLDAGGRELGQATRDGVPADWTAGGVALVCSSGAVTKSPDASVNAITLSGINRRGRENKGEVRAWFRDWKVSGGKVDAHPERAWGPILFAMHTLSRKVMKLTAQMAPVSAAAGPVRLEIQDGSRWRGAGESRIDRWARTATFRVAKWDDSKDVRYRLVFRDEQEHTFEGTVRRDPRHKSKVVVGALSCMNDLGFPHTEIRRNLEHHQPDVLLFVGDQIYERSASYGIERLPVERASLDYLRKWYLLGWSFRDLLRDTPSVCMPDDHDVYHGNVWGAGGRRAEGTGQPAQDSGGYQEPAEWVNMVQRTQTSHLPDPFDPAPVEQGIGVYYTDFLYGGVSMAIVEDRKWKSAPKMTMPKAQIVNGWAQNPEYKAPRDGDVKGAQLLGERQMQFLKHWAADWQGAWIKAVVTQTLFANLATLPRPANTDSVTGKLPILPPGGYAEGEMVVADHDSNGWPQTPRNEALRLVRRALAVHICGDQHLGSTVQYGVDEWNDAAWAICTPAISNLFPRRWYPPQPGANRKPGAARNLGEYLDGFGNKVTVHAVFNPRRVEAEPNPVNQRATGYTIAEFDRAGQSVTLTNWPRWVDASQPGAKPCEGWPISVRAAECGLPRSGWVLPAVERRAEAVVVEVRDAAGEHVYTHRVVEKSFVPPVRAAGKYTVTVRDGAGKVVWQRAEEARRV